jgi:hypothetical protein
MKNINIPDDQSVPSTPQLIKATVIAAAAAGILLVTIVMPAEYGIDPTGIGETIGLKKMGEIKVSLAEEAAAERLQSAAIKSNGAPVIASPQVAPVTAKIVASKPVPLSRPTILNHQMQVTLSPNEGTEIKVSLSKGKTVQYKWWTDQGKANFDVHGDSKTLKINYHNYSKGSEQTKEGEIEAAFDGYHGWFWRNRTSQTITVTLQTMGEYTTIKHIK